MMMSQYESERDALIAASDVPPEYDDVELSPERENPELDREPFTPPIVREHKVHVRGTCT